MQSGSPSCRRTSSSLAESADKLAGSKKLPQVAKELNDIFFIDIAPTWKLLKENEAFIKYVDQVRFGKVLSKYGLSKSKLQVI